MLKQMAGSREPVGGTNGPDGRGLLTLGDGRWWIYAWAWDEGDPYSRWYWNVPLEGNTVVLDGSTGRKRPQY